MTRLGFIADIHLASHKVHGGPVVGGLNERASLIVRAMRLARLQAEAKGCNDLFVLGDIFDTDAPTPQLVDAAIGALQSKQMRVHFLRGNHDMRSATEHDNALAVLRHVTGFHVYEEPTLIQPADDLRVIMVPYQSGQAEEWLPGAVEDALNGAPDFIGRQVLALHLGIFDAELAKAPWVKGSHDAVPIELLEALCYQHDISAVLAGNWHSRKIFESKSDALIIQVGALAPTGWDNAGAVGYGSLVVLDVNHSLVGLDVMEVPGPRFLSAKSAADLDDQKLECVPGCTIFGRLDVQAEEVRTAIVEGAQLGLHTVDVRVDDTARRAQVRNAAQSARCALTLQSAVSNYIKAMPEIDGYRKEVWSKVAHLLGFGGL